MAGTLQLVDHPGIKGKPAATGISAMRMAEPFPALFRTCTRKALTNF
ncbi:MAG: hypothetical protein ACK4F2_11495 [Novosphingobium meiothermophilum]|nr:hypothetical protein [Novosphingobium meiothermophilum]